MKNCIVIGGGVVGLFTAYLLREAGADVRLFERGRLGAEASWAGGGILTPLYPWRYSAALNRLSRQARSLYPTLSRSLWDETGIDPQWTQSGLLILDRDESDEARRWAESNGEVLIETDSLKQLEGRLGKGFGAGLYMPDIAQIHNPRLLKSLAASLRKRGVGIHEHEVVVSLSIHSGSVRGIKTARNDYSAENVIVAGGAWSSELLPQWQAGQGLYPVRGQMIRYAANPGLLNKIILYRGKYLIPRRDGGILAGSTLESVGFDGTTTEAARHELHKAAIAMLPALKNASISHHWAGLRPGSSGDLPITKKHPEINGLLLNSGHYRYGILLAPVSAQSIVEMVVTE